MAVAVCLFGHSPVAAQDNLGDDDGARIQVVPGTTTEHTLAARGDVYRYLQYAPKTYRADAAMPLLVMVHGCQTTAEKEQELTQLDRVADREGFVVVYPDVGEVGRNAPGPLNQCWNFLDPRSKHRDQGDAAVIAEMTRTVMAELSIDPERVYLVGISAGGLMTSISAAAYPDLYAAVGIASSSAYGDWTCLATRVGLPVATSARNAFQEMGERARVVPTFVIGGDQDLAFASACQRKALEQGLRTNNLVVSGTQTGPISLKPATTVEGQVPDGHAYTVQTYEDPDGCLVGERWNVHGMGHYWSGGTDDEKGPEGAEAVWTFLERFTKSGTQMPCAEANAPAKEPASEGVEGTAKAIKIVSTTRVSDRVTKYKVSTPSLAMSASVPLRVNVILPTGYAKNPKRHYPVLYALPGTSNLADVWLNNLDMVNRTRALPMIVVIPDGTYNADGGGFYTNWVDQKTSRGVANWETFHTQELVKWTDQRYRTINDRSGRGIVGISQGGFGSMSYAALHPSTYGAAASFSGATSIYYNALCHTGAALLVSTIMTGLNGVQPFAPFGDPLTNAANWRSRDPASNVSKLRNTHVEIYTSTGVPDQAELSDPAVLGAASMEALLHVSNKCFKQAADRAGITYGWHSYKQGTHAWKYGDRSLQDYLPRLTKFFKASAINDDVVVAPPPAEEPDQPDQPGEPEEPNQPPLTNQGSGPNGDDDAINGQRSGQEVAASGDLPDTGGPGLSQLIAGLLALMCGAASIRLSRNLIRST